MGVARRYMRTIKCIVAAFFFYSGLLYLVARLKTMLGGAEVKILCYHRIFANRKEVEEYPFKAMAISVENFEKQIQFLAKKFRVIPLREAASILKRRRITEHLAVITFDDGYFDIFQYCLSTLRKHNIPATVFLSIDPVENTSQLWFDRVASLQSKKIEWKKLEQELSQRLSPDGVTALSQILPQGQDITRENIVKAVSFLKGLPNCQREFAIRALEGCTYPNASETKDQVRYLSWEEVKELAESGITLGAHTMSHPILTKCDPAKAFLEIGGAKEELEKRLEKPILEFAYPNGDYNCSVQQIVIDCGFTCAVTIGNRGNTSARNLFALQRLNVSDQMMTGLSGKFSPALFACHLFGLFDFLKARDRVGHEE